MPILGSDVGTCDPGIPLVGTWIGVAIWESSWYHLGKSGLHVNLGCLLQINFCGQ